MKRILLLLFLLVTTFASAQTATPTTLIKTVIPFEQRDETSWITRYQKDITNYQKENKRLKDLSCDVLFLGSSSINLWDTIYEDFAPLKLIRRSYGGATLRDMIYNYNTIAKGYTPKSILLYVENDLGNHKEGVNAVKCFDLFRIFIDKLKKDYPNTPLIVVSLKPSQHKADQLKDQLLVNALLEENASAQGYTYVDITKVMYDEAGNLRTDIFKEDNLHMNAEGYKLWTAILKPLLIKKVRGE
ncbi:GDSL-type esterase/lipase family protein [Capnocytophaga ochracea]|jgi:lipolytic protein G-D-S-L family|uniref:GDSL-type esterase/lipase family protein n=1 Tax=Capnocytophaga TaxID=1016 RepID=UPI0006AFCD81|nr:MULTISPECIES: GDSL-type esterase/lipase family protein [Capnocytophaga]ALC98220.1 lipase [Capnocytophaga sp. oral taxon 323]MEB3016374.1 GDSL-type esterase/lipase family protein [Capnocytophaga ochracea]MEB3036122.1 GDSL-type esterase/lipase family protein [Capnocytophaga ochracea]